ncbi:hypothetical protein DA2_2563 [Desulfovibrio sp. A2]|nr:hypothetical protein DA2_2563 [Desulfovibrio sp. A2]
MLERTVYIPRYGIEINPWSGWTYENSPQWWKDHNSVKHKRDTNFEKATLENALYSMCALFSATIEYYKINFENYETKKYAMKELMGSLSPESSLLRLHQDNYLNHLYSF